MRRVVVTGLGIISSIGNNKETVLDALQKGKSGITVSQEFQDMEMKSCIWGNVKETDDYKNRASKEAIGQKKYRFMSDAAIYCHLAMEEAIIDAKLSEQLISHCRTGVVVGSGGASPKSQVAASDAMRSERKLRGVGTFVVPKAMASGIAAVLATNFGIRGVNYAISSACATSAHCIGHAAELIQFNKQDIVFAGGGEELCWQLACEFDAMHALSRNFNHDPEKASRPFDIKRDGFIIAGGGGIVVLEELESAKKRGATIYGEIIGYGATSDGQDMVAPSGEGAERCMRMALGEQNYRVDYINAHGTSTMVGDKKEVEAIQRVFKGAAVPMISSTKSMTGHALGAAGVHEAIYSLLMMQHAFIAPNVNLEQKDDTFKDLEINHQTVYKPLNIVMSNSFGFGGTNATLLMRRYT